MWFVFALLSAVFAALMSILAKIGIEGVNSNLATAIRTMAIFNTNEAGNREDGKAEGTEREYVESNLIWLLFRPPGFMSGAFFH